MSNTTTPLAPHSLEERIRTSGTPTLEQRLQEIQNSVSLIHAVCSRGILHDERFGDRSTIEIEELVALADRAQAAADHAYYLMRLPTVVLNLPVPDDDDVQRILPGVDDVDAAIEQLVTVQIEASLRKGGAR